MTGIGAVAVDLRGGVDAVHVGHLDVGDDQVGMGGGAQLDQLAAVLGHGDDLVAQERQDLLEVVAHVELVVGDGDLERTGHGVPRGRVMRKTGPGPVAVADRDPAAVGLDDPLGDGHAQAGPLGLGGVERVEDLRSLLGRDPRPVVAHGDPERGLAVELDVLGAGPRWRPGASRPPGRCPGYCGRPARGGTGRRRSAGRRRRSPRGGRPACPCGPARGGPRPRARHAPGRRDVLSSLIGAA